MRSIKNRNFNLRQRADELLGELAATSPQAVMDTLGEMMLDEEMRLNFHVERFETFLALPPEAVGQLAGAEHGVEGSSARSLAIFRRPISMSTRTRNFTRSRSCSLRSMQEGRSVFDRDLPEDSASLAASV